MANEIIRNIANIKNITGEPREDDDFDYKRAYLLMCSEMSDMIDRQAHTCANRKHMYPRSNQA